MKPFDLKKAMQRHQLITRGGIPAEFVAYKENADPNNRVVSLVEGEIKLHHDDGCSKYPQDMEFDLFLVEQFRYAIYDVELDAIVGSVTYENEQLAREALNSPKYLTWNYVMAKIEVL